MLSRPVRFKTACVCLLRSSLINGLIYIKMPFINEDLKRQTQAVLKRTGLDNIRVHYINGSSSSRVFCFQSHSPHCRFVVNGETNCKGRNSYKGQGEKMCNSRKNECQFPCGVCW